MKDLFALKLFTRVARLGSFSAAARELGLSQSQASRILSDLEADLGARLLSRTTRAVVPTEAGADYLARIEPILDALDEADQGLREGGAFRGVLRVSMPTAVGVREVIPRLPAFTARHPELRVHLLLDDRRQDLVREAVDVAIRLGRLKDASGTTKLIATIPRVIVASPGYLQGAGVPETPGDLARHRIVGGSATAVPWAWEFRQDGETTTLSLDPHVSSDENEGAVAAAVAGLGITSTTAWGCRRELEDGSLVRLLAGWETADVPVHVHYPAGRATRAAGRAFVEFIAADLGR